MDGGFLVGGICTRGTFTRHFMRASALALSVGFEREADYFGSITPHAPARYFRRLGFLAQNGAGKPGQHLLRQNASDLARTLRADAETIAEIKDKQRRHLPLVPEIRPSAMQSEPPSQREYNY